MKKVATLTIASPASETFSHRDISRLAEKLWRRKGRPEGRDHEIWLEAENQLRDGSRSRQEARDEKAFANPRFLFDGPSEGMMDELNRRFPGPSSKDTTSI